MFVRRGTGAWECIRNPWGDGPGPERQYWCHSIVFHPGTNVMFAALDARGSYNGIWRSKDSGKTWTQLRTGLPPGDRFGRVSLTIAPVAPHTIYALAADRHEGVLGVF